ncbi:hypothetical protein Golomagni_00794 [Golovinomyces magnicellulatus]|nr:hypothetical protein Golomagni_00794 [Golovinomyces magnicellulatus]
MAATINTDRDVLLGSIKPVNYHLSLYDLVLSGEFTYQGTVHILSSNSKGFKEFTLNAHQLQLNSAEVHLELSNSQHVFTSIKIDYDVPKQRATIHFSEEIPVSERITIVIKFQGTINSDMAGFYRSRYKPAATPLPSVPRDGDLCVMLSTQFESCDARRAFPCFDEPNLKATFDFEVEVPEDLVALSNMPEKASRATKNGLKLVSFERTPVMSTYLLAWAIGDFEFIEAFTKRQYGDKYLPVRVYTTRGLKSQGQFALDHAPKIVDYYSDIFGIEYPLPKCDLLAVHEFVSASPHSMENWGLITYRTTALLFDEQASDSRYKNRIAYVVAHELAHQWFGNLVTMDWWNELWLNEGFATWVGWLATDHIHPDWHVWPQFISEGMQTAFTLDSLRSTHPIEVCVRDALDVDQIFDSISYLKGSSVIRMLASHLGQDTFLKGVGAYLKAHAYGNAKKCDLWTSLSQESGQDIKHLMDPWIRNIGFPVLAVSEDQTKITVKQSRYLSTGDLKTHEDKTTWWVPLGLETNLRSTKATSVALTSKEETFSELDLSFYKINKEYRGFYRTKYPPARLMMLSRQAGQLSISEKIGLVGDAAALAVSGESSTVGLMAFVENFQSEKNYLVWSQIIGSLGNVKTAFYGNRPVIKSLKRFILSLISSAVEELGWEPSPNEDMLTSQLRALLIQTAGSNGHKSVVKEAKRRFDLYMSGQDKTTVHQNLRSAIFGVTIQKGGKMEYEALKNEWKSSVSIDGKEIALRALGRTRIPELHDDYLKLLFSEVATQDIHTGAMALSTNSKARLTLWNYIKSNFDEIKGKLSDNMIVLDRFLRISLMKFNEIKIEREIGEFFASKDNRGYDRTLGVISDTITGRAAYKERDITNLVEWLRCQGYMSEQ